ncbi:GAF domain-containing protein [Actinomadura barringtoniae]|uniref:GAF domain-containing protein n=1 Tax=Actinomadura barringtoniae TaxID=1427535 RepID=A0A939PEL7_9ACTN|nr:GAF domain-containing protein [Actinomadura barringtoniae]
MDTAVRHSGAQRGNVQLLDPQAGGLQIAVQRGFEKAFLDFFRVVPADGDDASSACGRALSSGRAVRVPNVAASSVFAGTAGLGVMLEAGARACMSTPLTDRTGQVLGMLSVHYERPQAITVADQRLQSVIAERAAVLLTTATSGPDDELMPAAG